MSPVVKKDCNLMSFVQKTRKNHGLEHATISLLLRDPGANHVIAGYSIPSGFFILGNVSTEAVKHYSDEALARMKAGESNLAISPFCGTNLVVAAALAALGTVSAIRFGGKGAGGFSRAFSNTLWALLASRPIGQLVQKHYTTSGDVLNVTITKVSHYNIGKLGVHWIQTDIIE